MFFRTIRRLSIYFSSFFFFFVETSEATERDSAVSIPPEGGRLGVE